MKKVIILIAGLLLSASSVFSQGCLPDGITFTTQEQIDNFQINYPGCVTIEGYVSIWGNDITNLHGLSMLKSINDDLNISDNPRLTNLTGLDCLRFVGGNLFIYNNDSLVKLSGIQNLDSVGESLEIKYNDRLDSIVELQELEYVGEDISIISNNKLVSLEGLENLTSHVNGGLLIEENSSLTSLNGLENVTSVGKDVRLSVNTHLQSISGLKHLTSIGGILWISSNDLLKDLDGLENLANIYNDLYILNNSSLESLKGLGNLTSAGNFSIFMIKGNSSLVNLNGLDNLSSVTGDFKIENNISLNNLEGIEKLTSIGGGLIIKSNQSLKSLKGIDSLISVRALIIEENSNLSDITSLKNIHPESISNGIYFFNNNTLSKCDIKSICDYLVNPLGTIYFEYNASGCKSLPEVEKACQLGLDQLNSINEFEMAPIPAGSFLNITTRSKFSKVEIDLLDQCGRLLIRKSYPGPDIVLDLTDLPPGLYFVRLSNNKTVEVGKFVKE